MSKQERWTAEEYRLYVTNGIEPTTPLGDEPVSNPFELPQARTVKRVSSGRCKRNIVHRTDLGVTFDSDTEEKRYEYLIARPDVSHVDVHPIFRHPNGTTFKPDFLVHQRPIWCDPTTGQSLRTAWVEDVKPPKKGGGPLLTTSYRRAKAAFDAWHPLGPCRTIWTDDGGKTWQESIDTTRPADARGRSEP